MLIRRNLKGKVERRIVIPRFVSYKIVCEEIENANKWRLLRLVAYIAEEVWERVNVE